MSILCCGIIHTGYGDNELSFDDSFDSDPLAHEQYIQEIYYITHKLEDTELSLREKQELENKRDLIVKKCGYK